MATSIYDFDTEFGPFEAFAPFAPYAPFALLALMSAPVQWWADAMLSTYGAMSEAMVIAMAYPFAMPAIAAPHGASTAEDEHPVTPGSRGAKRTAMG